MKNKNYLLLAIAGATYLAWKFVIKPNIAKKKSEEAKKNYDLFDSQRELIANALPQQNITNEINNFT